ncbi:hypothetical protein [Rhizobium leguminosarum]|nr:hypothetical protein [Rhizobium leguminosarum]
MKRGDCRLEPGYRSPAIRAERFAKFGFIVEEGPKVFWNDEPSE